MSDFLVDLSANPNARKWITRLGLPVPMPQKLRRQEGPWSERPLDNLPVVVGTGPNAALTEAIAETLTAAGANPWVVGSDTLLATFKTAGEAWGRLPEDASDASPDKSHALILDASGISDAEELRALYDFYSPRMKSLARCGRMVVLGRPASSIKDPIHAAAQAALEGFVRSAAKEVGRKGSTALLITVDDGAESRIQPVLRFALSPSSAFISGQVLHVSKKVAKFEDKAARPLDGKVALVTGAARGIGRATANALAREGAQVIVLDRPADNEIAAEAAAEVGGHLLLADVTDPEAPATIAAFVEEKFGGIDIIVHNAGITRDKTLAKMKPDWWDLTLDVNLGAVHRITEALKPHMNSGARIVCLSSIAGIAGNVGQTNYSASKSGIIGYVNALAPKLSRKGIAVNAIAPGFIETRLTAAIPTATREVARRLSNLSQGGLPEDIAETVVFLSTPGAGAMTGQVIRVCGGNLVGK